jgi:hypothetical protein
MIETYCKPLFKQIQNCETDIFALDNLQNAYENFKAKLCDDC